MLTPADLDELLTQARRNQEIQSRLDQVEEFLLAPHEPDSLLARLSQVVASIYHLDQVTVALLADNRRLDAVFGPDGEAPAGCFLRRRKEMRLILGDLERPFLEDRPGRDLAEFFFPGAERPASLAVLPLWVSGEMLGSLNLGANSGRRYRRGLDTHFLERLGAKVAFGLNGALLLGRARRMEQRQAVVEMAGAACHELAQPLATLELGLEKLRRMMGPDDQRAQDITGLMTQVERLGEMIKKISEVNEYVTRPYAQGLRIVDLSAAGGDDGLREPKGG
ncbi:MAG: DUF484 family protein [Desulfarculaceae bacterium]|nr:DUF484 family protein [Desulfarculaceae bacterium]MCF8072227.1 DUF484 family protein [Desulfarculaceae bacterium]MCF8100148.1 DUF484 family protein [Desulfarculaceae bacterium]MCF8117203.1 DUF484 family protein [Desulfarculaceae bacterium]